jgi:putative ABC transport system substrate-binding protein
MKSTEHLNRRSFSLAVLGCLLPAVVMAQRSSSEGQRIGLLLGDDPEGGAAAFRAALQALGYTEGRNLTIEQRSSLNPPAGTNPAADLARMKLELIVAHSLPGALALRTANPDMPLVIVTTPGFVTNGFARTLERPGGNATGIDELPPGVTGRRLELLKAAAPTISRVALLSTTPGTGSHETQLADAQAAASRLGITAKPFRATTVPELKQALSAIGADGMDGLLNFQGGLSYVNRQLIVDFAGSQRMPAIYQATVFAEAGGLMTWAPDLVDQFRMAAEYVVQILKGARPGDLAVRHPRRYYLTLNRAAAKALGLTFPPALLAKADNVLP